MSERQRVFLWLSFSSCVSRCRPPCAPYLTSESCSSASGPRCCGTPTFPLWTRLSSPPWRWVQSHPGRFCWVWCRASCWDKTTSCFCSDHQGPGLLPRLQEQIHVELPARRPAGSARVLHSPGALPLLLPGTRYAHTWEPGRDQGTGPGTSSNHGPLSVSLPKTKLFLDWRLMLVLLLGGEPERFGLPGLQVSATQA